MNRFAKMKKERIYTLFETLSIRGLFFPQKKRGKEEKKRRENSTKNYLEKEKHPMQNHDQRRSRRFCIVHLR